MILFDNSSQADFLLVTGDAYVDHPSFGAAVIARVLEAEGYSVAVLAQPRWDSCADFAAMGRPRLGVMVTSGNIDSMVAHYTAAKRRRSEDLYTMGGVAGKRPDRAVIVYSNLARQAFPGIRVVIGGLEASLRRFAHYDYWDDSVRRSVLLDSKADILVYGMGETATREIARRLSENEPLPGIRGTCVVLRGSESEVGKTLRQDFLTCPGFEEVSSDPAAYSRATCLQYDEHDPVRGRVLLQKHGGSTLVCYPPAMPLTTAELDAVAALPFTRRPMPDSELAVPSIEEVKFSLIHNRGCFGGCNFCSLAFHQGRMISVRSERSLIAEAKAMTVDPDFKGYIHDVGGPTANMRHLSCQGQLKNGMCKRNCLTPAPCPKLDSSHKAYLSLLRRLRELPSVKKVFVRSGIRYDYLLLDKQSECFDELVRHHISGQLKVAPEHCQNNVLDLMGKPRWETYLEFTRQYAKRNKESGQKQFLVPYLISSHPGSTLGDAIALAEKLNKMGRWPEQVQDFYPTPGTFSTSMYYTGLHPRTLEAVYVAKTPKEKAMQRALLQWRNPKNRGLVIAALKEAGRSDLIGFGAGCLIKPNGGHAKPHRAKPPAAKPVQASKPAKRTKPPGKAKTTRKG